MNIKTTGPKAVVKEMMARFEDAYALALPHFERMDRIERIYTNQIDTYNWPTMSEVSIPLTFMAVEEQLPFAMSHLFPRSRWFNLVPETQTDMEVVRRVEDGINYALKNEMDIVQTAFPCIKDCYKYGVGYGLVDTELVTLPEAADISVFGEGGSETGTRRVMVAGEPVPQVVLRYIPPVCVVPMADGANTDGPNAASGHFVLRLYTEPQFRRLHGAKDSDGKPIFDGDTEAIIKDARRQRFDYRMKINNLLAKLAHIDVAYINNESRHFPVVIPVLVGYFQNEHAWIANGNTLIWHIKDSFQSLRSDLVKFSAWPDGNKWFPMGVTEASERLATGTNIWYNGMLDLAMYMMAPPRLINVNALTEPNKVGRGPRTDIKITTPPDQAMAYAALPQMPTQLFELGALLRQMHSSTNAQTDAVRQGVAGLVRGGGNALEAMLSTTTGRQYLASLMLLTGGVKSLVEKTIIKKQIVVDGGVSFIERRVNPATGKDMIAEQSITPEELRRVYRVELNHPCSKLNSMNAFAENAAYFDRAFKFPEMFRMRALFEELSGDVDKVNRTMRSDEEQAKIAQQQQMAQQSQPPMTDGEKAMGGGANVPGGEGLEQ